LTLIILNVAKFYIAQKDYSTAEKVDGSIPNFGHFIITRKTLLMGFATRKSEVFENVHECIVHYWRVLDSSF